MPARMRVAHGGQHFENVIAVGRGPFQVTLGDYCVLAEVHSGNLPGQGCLQFPGLVLKPVEFGVKLVAEQRGLETGDIAIMSSSAGDAARVHGVEYYK